ncbi:hypothetical protein DPMN_009027 [Dreissena polymorpha]|uniref:Uncharacterized protein n=1 Tax=Dreissena polymorpha TaxID=45954 RepID=A0A9D4MZJ0_DREPO|nr:hypothetical protein DPMN_009027 [Dreissena polymorpha]
MYPSKKIPDRNWDGNQGLPVKNQADTLQRGYQGRQTLYSAAIKAGRHSTARLSRQADTLQRGYQGWIIL